MLTSNSKNPHLLTIGIIKFKNTIDSPFMASLSLKILKNLNDNYYLLYHNSSASIIVCSIFVNGVSDGKNLWIFLLGNFKYSDFAGLTSCMIERIVSSSSSPFFDKLRIFTA